MGIIKAWAATEKKPKTVRLSNEQRGDASGKNHEKVVLLRQLRGNSGKNRGGRVENRGNRVERIDREVGIPVVVAKKQKKVVLLIRNP